MYHWSNDIFSLNGVFPYQCVNTFKMSQKFVRTLSKIDFVVLWLPLIVLHRSMSELSIKFIPIWEALPRIGVTGDFTTQKYNECTFDTFHCPVCGVFTRGIHKNCYASLCIISRVVVFLRFPPFLFPVALTYSEKGKTLQDAPVSISNVTSCCLLTIQVTRTILDFLPVLKTACASSSLTSQHSFFTDTVTYIRLLCTHVL